MIRPAVPKNRRGLTLVEVLISLAVIGVGAVGVIYMEKAKWRNVATTRNIDSSVKAVEEYIENLRLNIRMDQANYYPPVDTSFFHDGVSVTCTVSDVYDNQSPPNLLQNVKKLSIDAIWEVDGSPDTLHLVTCVAKDF